MAKINAELKSLPWEIIKNFILENKFLTTGLVFGLIFLIIGIVQLISSGKSSNQIEIVPAGRTNQLGKILVDVGGAVTKPGVYELEEGSRVGNAIEMAGNFSPNADLSWIAKNLNLAVKISDGTKIYVPEIGQSGFVSTEKGIRRESGKININSANLAELESLPAIGPVTASKIISGRPYNSVEELLTKKITGKATFDKIKELISAF